VDDQFFLNLGPAHNTALADAQGVGATRNDDSGSGGGCNPSVPCDPLPPPEGWETV
jgi:hypothetical protein